MQEVHTPLVLSLTIATEPEMFTHSANNMFVFPLFFLTLFNCKGKGASVWLNKGSRASDQAPMKRNDALDEPLAGVAGSRCLTAAQAQLA